MKCCLHLLIVASVFLREKTNASLQLLSVSPLLCTFLKLPFLTKTRPPLPFSQLIQERKAQTLLVHLPSQAAQCQVNPTTCIFSFPRLPNLLFARMQASDFVVVFVYIFRLILLCGFLLFSSIFLFSLYLVSVSDCSYVTKITSLSKITKISLLTTVLSPV